MSLRPVFTLVLGAVLLIVSQVNNLFSLFRSVDWLRINAPGLFFALSAPRVQLTLVLAGLAMCAFGLYETLKKPKRDLLTSSSLQFPIEEKPRERDATMFRATARLEHVFIPSATTPPRELRASTSGEGVQRFDVGVVPHVLEFKSSGLVIPVRDLPKGIELEGRKLTISCEGKELVVNDHGQALPFHVHVHAATVPQVLGPTINQVENSMRFDKPHNRFWVTFVNDGDVKACGITTKRWIEIGGYSQDSSGKLSAFSGFNTFDTPTCQSLQPLSPKEQVSYSWFDESSQYEERLKDNEAIVRYRIEFSYLRVPDEMEGEQTTKRFCYEVPRNPEPLGIVKCRANN
jgi:hypothetical protein